MIMITIIMIMITIMIMIMITLIIMNMIMNMRCFGWIRHFFLLHYSITPPPLLSAVDLTTTTVTTTTTTSVTTNKRMLGLQSRVLKSTVKYSIKSLGGKGGQGGQGESQSILRASHKPLKAKQRDWRATWSHFVIETTLKIRQNKSSLIVCLLFYLTGFLYYLHLEPYDTPPLLLPPLFPPTATPAAAAPAPLGAPPLNGAPSPTEGSESFSFSYTDADDDQESPGGGGGGGEETKGTWSVRWLTRVILVSLVIRTPAAESAGDWSRFYELCWPIFLEVVVFGLVATSMLGHYNPVVVSRISAENLTRHTVIVGFEHLGERIVDHLRATNSPYCLVDDSYDRVADLIKIVDPVIVGSPTDLACLEAAQVAHCKEVFVTVNQLHQAIIACFNIRSLNKVCQVYVQIFEHEEFKDYFQKDPLNATTCESHPCFRLFVFFFLVLLTHLCAPCPPSFHLAVGHLLGAGVD